MIAQQLQTYREIVAGPPAGNRPARAAGEASGERVDVGQVHVHGVVDLLAELEGREGRNRSGDGIDSTEGIREIAGDEGANFLGFQIVGVVIAVTENVSAEHDAALDLGAEA